MKKIHITFGRIGAKVQIVELLEDSSVLDLKNILSITKKDGIFYRNKKRLNLNTLLNDKDIIIYAFSIVGEATVRRNGRHWRVNKYDPDDIFPSDFHAHNLDKKDETLDLYTGYLYRAHTKQKIAKLRDKDYIGVLIDLSKRKNFQKKSSEILAKLNSY